MVGRSTVAIFFLSFPHKNRFSDPFPRWHVDQRPCRLRAYIHIVCIRGQSHTQWISKRVKPGGRHPSRQNIVSAGRNILNMYINTHACGMRPGFCRSFVKPLFVVLYTRLYSCVYVSPLNIYVAAILYMIYIYI